MGREGLALPHGVSGVQLAGEGEMSVEVGAEHALQRPFGDGLEKQSQLRGEGGGLSREWIRQER